MAIPKVIYQTFKTNKIPLLTKFYIWRFLRKNKGYRREFFDDAQVDAFVKESFDERTYRAYSRLQIGAAKADFFRYAILYIRGGIYLDLDSDITGKLDQVIRTDDVAVVAREKKWQQYFAQWALIFDKGHPFLKETIKLIVENIENNRFPHDVHSMTGPTVYSLAINNVIARNPEVSYRIYTDDYKGIMKFKYKLGKILIYGDRSKHWKKLQKVIPVVKAEN
ncbi:glycosyl transferase [Sphingobacterium sp. arapr2]|nr:glycosyl transferase [Sphingobacterium sp.]NPE49226.1 glycosyl transferase [Sphingobacterium prati]